MRFKTIITIALVVLMMGMAVTAQAADVGGFLLNGACAVWGFCMMKKIDNKDVNWYVGFSASVFTLRALYSLVSDK